jgi:hypothetical protein|tara:strand:- start:34 stop:159 length:126 start_codon:yes stop_codon:yes gene_type:complete
MVEKSGRNKKALDLALELCDIQIGASCACALENWNSKCCKK